ncbi:hypothetical protein ADUPG1_013767 [Aduncisulcus paluster]|uniref:EF-hand domain-containing protein n=1 Tax=Aduncisulcus paluster TaxID=2918883 RepID=A0ABQ5K4L2_9EUKA|nr:hypothetical protein ADUPG1_013767 [Aduncisulcus paluster]
MSSVEITETELRELFNLVDSDSGGTIDADEFRALLTQIGYPMSRSEVIDLVKSYSPSGEIDFSLFCDILVKTSCSDERLAEIKGAFRIIRERTVAHRLLGRGQMKRDVLLQQLVDYMEGDLSIEEAEQLLLLVNPDDRDIIDIDVIFWILFFIAGAIVMSPFMDRVKFTIAIPEGSYSEEALEDFATILGEGETFTTVFMVTGDSEHLSLSNTNVQSLLTNLFYVLGGYSASYPCPESLQDNTVVSYYSLAALAAANDYDLSILQAKTMPENSAGDQAYLTKITVPMPESGETQQCVDDLDAIVSTLTSSLDMTGLSYGFVGEYYGISEVEKTVKKDMELMDATSIPIALIILFLVLGSFKLMLIPLISFVASITFGIFWGWVITYASWDVSSLAPSITMSVGVAFSLDYALFLLSRFKTEVETGHSPRLAIKKTVQSSGHTVVVSGVAIAVCFASMLIYPADIAASLGACAAIVLVGVVLCNMTLVPVVMLLLKDFFAAKYLQRYRATADGADFHMYERVGKSLLGRVGYNSLAGKIPESTHKLLVAEAKREMDFEIDTLHSHQRILDALESSKKSGKVSVLQISPEIGTDSPKAQLSLSFGEMEKVAKVCKKQWSQTHKKYFVERFESLRSLYNKDTHEVDSSQYSKTCSNFVESFSRTAQKYDVELLNDASLMTTESAISHLTASHSSHNHTGMSLQASRSGFWGTILDIFSPKKVKSVDSELSSDQAEITELAVSAQKDSVWFRLSSWITESTSHSIITILLILLVSSPFFVALGWLETSSDMNQMFPSSGDFADNMDTLANIAGQGVLGPFEVLLSSKTTGGAIIDGWRADENTLTTQTFNALYTLKNGIIDIVNNAVEDESEQIDSSSVLSIQCPGTDIDVSTAGFYLSSARSAAVTDAYKVIYSTSNNATDAEVTDIVGTVMEVTLNGSPFSATAETILEDIREYLDDFNDSNTYNLTAIVYGGPSTSYDLAEEVNTYFPWQILIVAFILIVVVAVTFKSIMMPIVMVVTIGMTLAFIMGFITIIFVLGWFDFISTLEDVRSVFWIAPIFTISILAGLSMDYQTFISMRVFELRRAGYDYRSSITRAQYTTSPIISFAALIMAVAFFGLELSSLILLCIFGTTLAVAVLYDSHVIRGMFFPAVLNLLGERTYYPGKVPEGVKDSFVMEIEEEEELEKEEEEEKEVGTGMEALEVMEMESVRNETI